MLATNFQKCFWYKNILIKTRLNCVHEISWQVTIELRCHANFLFCLSNQFSMKISNELCLTCQMKKYEKVERRLDQISTWLTKAADSFSV